jgi:DNA-binding transcriptional ArsR family regulator
MPIGVSIVGEESPWELPGPTIFGSKMRTVLLMLVAVLEETYPAELSRYLGSSISSVQRTLDKIEDDGLIASRPRVVRAVTLNPLYPAVKELRALLLRLADGYPEYRRLKESRRLRPRRRNKPL